MKGTAPMLKCDRCGSQVESVIWVDKQKLCLTCSAMQGQEDEESASYSPVVSLDELRAAKETMIRAWHAAEHENQMKDMHGHFVPKLNLVLAKHHAEVLTALATTFAATHGLHEEGVE